MSKKGNNQGQVGFASKRMFQPQNQQKREEQYSEFSENGRMGHQPTMEYVREPGGFSAGGPAGGPENRRFGAASGAGGNHRHYPAPMNSQESGRRRNRGQGGFSTDNSHRSSQIGKRDSNYGYQPPQINQGGFGGSRRERNEMGLVKKQASQFQRTDQPQYPRKVNSGQFSQPSHSISSKAGSQANAQKSINQPYIPPNLEKLNPVREFDTKTVFPGHGGTSWKPPPFAPGISFFKGVNNTPNHSVGRYIVPWDCKHSDYVYMIFPQNIFQGRLTKVDLKAEIDKALTDTKTWKVGHGYSFYFVFMILIIVLNMIALGVLYYFYMPFVDYWIVQTTGWMVYGPLIFCFFYFVFMLVFVKGGEQKRTLLRQMKIYQTLEKINNNELRDVDVRLKMGSYSAWFEILFDPFKNLPDSDDEYEDLPKMDLKEEEMEVYEDETERLKDQEVGAGVDGGFNTKEERMERLKRIEEELRSEASAMKSEKKGADPKGSEPGERPSDGDKKSQKAEKKKEKRLKKDGSRSSQGEANEDEPQQSVVDQAEKEDPSVSQKHRSRKSHKPPKNNKKDHSSGDDKDSKKGSRSSKGSTEGSKKFKLNLQKTKGDEEDPEKSSRNKKRRKRDKTAERKKHPKSIEERDSKDSDRPTHHKQSVPDSQISSKRKFGSREFNFTKRIDTPSPESKRLQPSNIGLPSSRQTSPNRSRLFQQRRSNLKKKSKKLTLKERLKQRRMQKRSRNEADLSNSRIDPDESKISLRGGDDDDNSYNDGVFYGNNENIPQNRNFRRSAKKNSRNSSKIKGRKVDSIVFNGPKNKNFRRDSPKKSSRNMNLMGSAAMVSERSYNAFGGSKGTDRSSRLESGFRDRSGADGAGERGSQMSGVKTRMSAKQRRFYNKLKRKNKSNVSPESKVSYSTMERRQIEVHFDSNVPKAETVFDPQKSCNLMVFNPHP